MLVLYLFIGRYIGDLEFVKFFLLNLALEYLVVWKFDVTFECAMREILMTVKAIFDFTTSNSNQIKDTIIYINGTDTGNPQTLGYRASSDG